MANEVDVLTSNLKWIEDKYVGLLKENLMLKNNAVITKFTIRKLNCTIRDLHKYLIDKHSFYSEITYTTIMREEDREELLALGITVDEINEYIVRANGSKGE